MRHLCAAVVTVVVALSATPSLAQGMLKPPAWNPATIETFKGAIAAERDVGRFDLHVIAVRTDSGNRLVLLGPKELLDPALVALAPGAVVEVTASKAKGERGRDFYLASVVKAGGKEYRVRNDQGQFVGKDGQPLKR
jgi:hypothetical protein